MENVILRKEIIDKVQTLREERNMIQYCDAVHIAPAMAALTKKIITTIQYTIFDIDDVCEKDELPLEHLQLLIDDARQDILAQVCIAVGDEEKARVYTQRLFDFHRMELDMRDVCTDPEIKTPLDYSMSDFYLLKSCDVFLSRKIIADISQATGFYDSIVELYDQLGEVLDDMMDVQEDVNAIIYIRFLISLVERGAQETIAEYTDFVFQGFLYLKDHTEQLHGLGLDVSGLHRSLEHFLSQDRSSITWSKTNEMLFGQKNR